MEVNYFDKAQKVTARIISFGDFPEQLLEVNYFDKAQKGTARITSFGDFPVQLLEVNCLVLEILQNNF